MIMQVTVGAETSREGRDGMSLRAPLSAQRVIHAFASVPEGAVLMLTV